MFIKYKNTVSKIEKYYDEWTDRYMTVGGELIEAYRCKNDNDLLDYYIQSAQLCNGQKIIDAGCGVCGPAAYFAKKLHVSIDAITISNVQIERCKSILNKYILAGTVNIIKGDFHYLDSLFNHNSYDRVLFIESLGHSSNPQKVLKSAFRVLKPGGKVYVKDFYSKINGSYSQRKKYKKILQNINKFYAWNTLNLSSIIKMISKIGYEIEYIQKPLFIYDNSKIIAFESQNNINLYGDIEPVVPVYWLEILIQKP